MKKQENRKTATEKEKEEFPGYPQDASGQDIFNKHKVDKEVDPEDTHHSKTTEESGRKNEKDFTEGVSGADLDVPGAELDDQQEDIGSEDEENNQYSRAKN